MAPGSVSRACRFAWNVNPVDLVVATFCVNKAIQAVSFFGWWWFVMVGDQAAAGGGRPSHHHHYHNHHHQSEAASTPLSSSSSFYMFPTRLFSEPLTPLQLVIGAQLIIIGQMLNVSVYRAIGRDGVYYGEVDGSLTARPRTICSL